jgi:hypothetical protein
MRERIEIHRCFKRETNASDSKASGISFNMEIGAYYRKHKQKSSRYSLFFIKTKK